jgi:hypothetical protein
VAEGGHSMATGIDHERAQVAAGGYLLMVGVGHGTSSSEEEMEHGAAVGEVEVDEM